MFINRDRDARYKSLAANVIKGNEGVIASYIMLAPVMIMTSEHCTRIQADDRDSIEKAQAMLRESNNLQARTATIYQEGELVNIQQAQFEIDGTGSKGASHMQPYLWLCYSEDPPGRMDLSRKGL